MFGMTKTLIVVYKDEMVVNQLKKLVETNDDNGEDQIVGTTDGSINIVSWNEKVWLDNKKAGNIKDKVLFLGDVKGTDKLVPIIDVQFDLYGVRFGWAGNQAILYADPKALENDDKYSSFVNELSTYPVPETIKTPIRKRTQIEHESTNVDDGSDNDKKSVLFLKKAKNVAAGVAGAAGGAVVGIAEEVKERKSLKRQMLFYGVIRMYQDSLESFMNQ